MPCAVGWVFRFWADFWFGAVRANRRGAVCYHRPMTNGGFPEAFRSRIVASGEESPDQLLANPANWRGHPSGQREALAAVLDEVGFVAPVIVNRTTGRLIDGHLRVELALARDETMIPVSYVELTEAEERLVLATYDPLGDLAFADPARLGELLSEITPSSAEVTELLGNLAHATGAEAPKFDVGTVGEQSTLDQKNPMKCPGCGYEWRP
jgi:hypothetical protein